LALAVPLSRFTSRVGGGSAFFVRPLGHVTNNNNKQMKRYIKYIIIAAVVALPAVSAFAEPDQATQTAFTKLLAALIADDYDAYKAQCTDEMMANIPKGAVDKLSQMMAPRAKQGYDTQYLGELDQHGYKVHLWRLHFKDGSDDVLTTLCMKAGKIGSFNVMMFALYPPK
jgi:hypothetical protein